MVVFILLFYILLGCSFTEITGQITIEFDQPSSSTQYLFDTNDVKIIWNYRINGTSENPTVKIFAKISGNEINIITLIGTRPPITDDRYEKKLTARRNISTTIINFKNFTAEDFTNYTIRVEYDLENEVTAESVRALVQEVKPTKPRISCGTRRVISNITVVEGDNFECSCVSTGLPLPSIVWKLPGGNSSVLKKESISRSEADNYTCIASNQFGSRNESVLQVKVQYPPSSPQVTSSTKTSFIGQKVFFTCTADGDPIPELSWKTPDNQTIHSTGSFAVVLNSSRQFGVYSCIANNLHGNTSNNVTLRQAFVPGKIRFVSNTTTTFEIVLRWSEPDDGGYSIRTYVVRVSQKGKNITKEDLLQLQYTAKNLQRNTTYTFCVSASNYVGTGNESCVQLTTLYEGPPSVPAKPTLELGDDMITVTWEKVDGNPTHYIVEYKTKTDKEWMRSRHSSLTHLEYEIVNTRPHEVYSVRILAENEDGYTIGKVAVAIIPPVYHTTTISTSGSPRQSTTIENTQEPVDGTVPREVSGGLSTTFIIITVLLVALVIVAVLIFVLWLKRRGDNRNRHFAVRHVAGPLGDLYAQVENKNIKGKPKDERNDLVYAELSDFDPRASVNRAPEPHHTEYADISHVLAQVPREDPDYEDIPVRDGEELPDAPINRKLDRPNSIGI